MEHVELSEACNPFHVELILSQVTFVDLLGVLRSKLVPTSAIKQMLEKGAGFAGYAVHFDMTTADADLVSIRLDFLVCNLIKVRI